MLETNDFNKVIKDNFGNYLDYDSTDYWFSENLDIRVFAKEGASFLDLEETIYYYINNELKDIVKGPVLFAKNGDRKWRSLSKKDIKLLYSKLLPTSSNVFEIYE